jgi:hypothetical protein
MLQVAQKFPQINNKPLNKNSQAHIVNSNRALQGASSLLYGKQSFSLPRSRTISSPSSGRRLDKKTPRFP